MRRRVQAVGGGARPCGGTFGATMTRNGRPGPAASAISDGGGPEPEPEILATAIVIYQVAGGYPSDGWAALLVPYPELVSVTFTIDYGYTGATPPIIGNRFGNFSEVIVPDLANTDWLTGTYVYNGQSYSVDII
jgi:hypothetical protein